MASSAIRLAVIGGDGIGPEVVAEALKVLQAAGVLVERDQLRPGRAALAPHGRDAARLGAGRDPGPGRDPARGGRRSYRAERGAGTRAAAPAPLRARPVREPAAGPALPGVASPLSSLRPESIDMLVVREGTEGPYIEAGGVMRKGTPDEVATQESLNTAFGVRRVIRYACERAAERPDRKLTLVHKTNVLAYAGDLWQRTVDAAGEGVHRHLGGLLPRGRRLHVLRHPAGAVRRRSSPTTCSVTS